MLSAILRSYLNKIRIKTMKIKLNKLNAQGFSHHLLIPLIAIVVIGGIGAYIVTKPKAAVAITPESICGPGYVRSSYGMNKYPNAKGNEYILINKKLEKACGVYMSIGPEYGKSKKMGVKINVVKSKSPNKVVVKGGIDQGTFKQYAGPVYVNYKGFGKKGYSISLSYTQNNFKYSSTSYSIF